MINKIKSTFYETIPIFAGYIFLGMAFGISMKEMGLPIWSIILCSLIIYSGSLQFALIPILAARNSLVSVFMVTILVNARHIFYGITMLKEYNKLPFLEKIYNIFALTDETFSLVVTKINEKNKNYTIISLLNHLYWILGGLIGALLGEFIKFDMSGIDFAMTALFTIIVVEQTLDAYDKFKNGEINIKEFLLPLTLGLVATFISLIIFGKDNFLIASMIIILTFLYFEYIKGGNND